MTEDAARPAAPTRPTVLDRVGGPWGIAYSALPVGVFVVAAAFLEPSSTIVLSIAAALALTGFRLLRGEPLTASLGGVFAVAAAAGIVAWTGSAKDVLLVGAWVAVVGAVALIGSLLLRRPLTGVVWNALHGNRYTWREDRPTLLAHDVATLAAGVVSAAWFVVSQSPYPVDATGGPAFAEIAVGIPLTVLVALVVVRAFRRSTQRLVTSPAS